MSKAKPLPSQDELRRLFDFDPDTGQLIWRWREDRSSQWNGHFAGTRPDSRHKGYIRVKINGERFSAHRVIWKLAYGSIPDHLQIDHINGITDDNRLENLRLVSGRQNQLNRGCDKGRGYKGVYRKGNRWKAEITTREGRKYLGLFKTPEQAAIAYDSAARRWHGEHARLNFPNVHDSAA